MPNDVQIVCMALIASHNNGKESVDWPFGVDKAEAVMSILGLWPEVQRRYTRPAGKFDPHTGEHLTPLGKDAARRHAAIRDTVFAVAGGRRMESDALPTSVELRDAGFYRGNYPRLRGNDAGTWALAFRAVHNSRMGLLAVVDLARAAGCFVVS